MELTPSSQEQRQKARFKTDISAQAVVSDGRKFAVSVSNISLSGLQLCCDHKLVKALMSELLPHTSSNPIRFHLHFCVNTTQRTHVPIHIVCLQVYLRRLGDDSFLLGCQFESFKNDCEMALQDHLQHFAKPE